MECLSFYKIKHRNPKRRRLASPEPFNCHQYVGDALPTNKVFQAKAGFMIMPNYALSYFSWADHVDSMLTNTNAVFMAQMNVQFIKENLWGCLILWEALQSKQLRAGARQKN